MCRIGEKGITGDERRERKIRIVCLTLYGREKEIERITEKKED